MHRTITFGTSARGTALTATEIGDPSRPAVLVVGCIHGDEPAGIAVVDRLLASSATPMEHLWLVETLNPDGQTADTRGNAHGVDLNRNFPDGWRPLDSPGGLHYAGPRALSEPESSAMAVLLQRSNPSVGIWFHQALDVIDTSQGPRRVEDELARRLDVREQALSDYPGSAIGYEDRLFPATAFAFELPGGVLSAARSAQIAAAIQTVADELPAPLGHP